jgi:nucleotide-binding universal stress UspA family protein
MDFQSILVPVDFSQCSRQAVAVVRAFAADDQRVTFSHAVAPWQPGVHRVLFPYAALGEDEAAFEHEIVTETRTSLMERYGADTDDVAVSYGPPSEVLVDHAARFDSDLVVMGSFGETGLEPGLVGSTAERFVRRATQPVLLVRENGAREVRKVLVALDLGPSSKSVYQAAIQLATQAGASLDALFVLADPFAQDHLGLVQKVVKFDKARLRARLQGQIEALFDELVTALEPGYAELPDVHDLTRSRRIQFGDPASEILSEVDRLDADVVVVGFNRGDEGRKRSSGLGQIASNVVRKSSCHILLSPQPETVKGT